MFYILFFIYISLSWLIKFDIAEYGAHTRGENMETWPKMSKNMQFLGINALVLQKPDVCKKCGFTKSKL